MSKTTLFDLDGKIAFVSGASRGIGEAIAKLLAQQGAHVIVSSRKIEGCQAVADAITAAGGKATAVACHIGTSTAASRPQRRKKIRKRALPSESSMLFPKINR